MYFKSFSLFSIFFYYPKNEHLGILTAFALKSIYFIPQTTCYAPFKAQLPGASHLDLLGFKSEKDENVSKTFITSIKDSYLKEKDAVSTAYALHKNVWLKMISSFMF